MAYKVQGKNYSFESTEIGKEEKEAVFETEEEAQAFIETLKITLPPDEYKIIPVIEEIGD